MHYIWNLVLYRPIINILAFLISIIPGGDVGIAIIILTIFVKVVLYPLSQHSIESQAKMTILTPELNKIKASGASREEQAKMTFDLYKKHQANPFSGCLVQIPILIVIIALYTAFRTGINFDNGILYSFVHMPEHINMLFLGLIDISKKSIILAILAGISQYLLAQFMPKPPPPASTSNSFQDSLSQSMNMQMKYIFPFLVGFIAYIVSGAVALYYIISNLFTVCQQIYATKKRDKLIVLNKSA
jgi:YidC/Oxa1 family membrane protein insertase